MRLKILGVLLAILSPASFLPLWTWEVRPVHETAASGDITKEIFLPYWEVVAPGDKGRGSGTVIRVDGEILVLTAAHVVEGYAVDREEVITDERGEKHTENKREVRPCRLRKVFEGSKTLDILGDVVAYSAPEEKGGNDLALVRPKDVAGLVPAARIGLHDDVTLGEEVWYIGTTGGQHARLEKSIIAKKPWRIFNRNFNATNGCGYFGNSGGGLYIKRDGGYVLAGVITRAAFYNPGHPCIGAKTPADIRNFLRQYKSMKVGKSPAKETLPRMPGVTYWP